MLEIVTEEESREILADALRLARKEADLNPYKVQVASESEKERYGDPFYVNNTTVRDYEEGGRPTPAKLLTLARIYKVPISRFFEALGASDSEICGHSYTHKEAAIIRQSRNPEFTECYALLFRLLREHPGLAGEIRGALKVLKPRGPSIKSAEVTGGG